MELLNIDKDLFLGFKLLYRRLEFMLFPAGRLCSYGQDSMVRKKSRYSKPMAITVITAVFLVMVGFLVFKTNLLKTGSMSVAGLSGVVSVRGTVSLEQLKLSKQEILAINNAVAEHKNTFSKINLHLDAKGGSKNITDSTVLTWEMAMDTTGDCEVKSWSRKVKRGDLVNQMVAYMHKAAREYKEFQKYPDVNQKFQTLYI